MKKKINVIDLLIIIVILAGIAFAGVAVTKKANTEPDPTLLIQYYIEEVDDWVADQVEIGADLYDDNAEVNLGKVVDIERKESVSWGGTSEGQYVQTSREGFSSLLITGEVQGEKTSIGATIDNQKYGVGHSMVLRAGDAKMYLRVYNISVKE